MAGESQRYWLTFPVEQVKRPLIWQMSKHFDLIFNIRNASVTERVGNDCTGNSRVSGRPSNSR